MWQLEQAIHGIADGCAQLGIPVTGGNVSLYNQTAGVNILPTPVVGVLGVIDDVRRRTIPGIGQDTGETLLLLGDTRDEFDGSAWAEVRARPPRRAAAEGRPGGGAHARRDPDRRLAGRDDLRRARPVRRWAGAGAGGDVPGRRDRCPDRAARGCRSRSSGCSPSRPPGWWSRCRAPRSCGSPRCAPVRRQPWVKIGVVDAGDTGAPDEQFLDIQDVARLAAR